VHALIRRASHEAEPSRLLTGELTLDLLTREVIRSGKRIDLQPGEFSLLEYLMRNSGSRSPYADDPIKRRSRDVLGSAGKSRAI
jgi:DNA-binding response OmpR family regulator